MRVHHILFIAAIFAFSFGYANNGVSIKTIVIDAGHGGKDPGASGPGKTHEKDVALLVALKLGDYIQKNFPDVNVIYTRKTDVFLELHERADIANQAKADLFIAIHCNASPNDEAYGTSTYVLGLHRTEANLEVAKRENAVILLEENRDKNYEFDPNSPEGHIIMSMKQNAFLDQSIDFASKAENQLENYARRKSLGVKQAGFYVLYKTTMPSLLAEIGFISNPEEEKFLNSAKGQDLIATGLFNAFKNYKSEMEGSNAPAETNREEAKQVASEVKTEKTAPAPEKQTTVTTEVKSEKPAIENKVSSTEAKSEKTVTENKTSASATTNSTTTTLQSGKTIRKPIENASGGGIAKANVDESNNPKSEESTSVEVSNKPQKTTATKAETAVTKTEPVKVVEPKSEKKSEVKAVEPKSTPAPEHKTESGTVFKIQLFALKGDCKECDKVSKLFNVLSTEELPNGIKRYYAGNVKTYAEAKNLLGTALENGYKDAFIIGLKEGKRLSSDQLKAIEK